MAVPVLLPSQTERRVEMELLKEVLLPFVTAFMGGFAGWFFKRHRLARENRQLDKTTEAQEITNFGAAVGTWQKLVSALDDQIIKLLAQRKEDSRRITELTHEVYSLRQQVDQLRKQLSRYECMDCVPVHPVSGEIPPPVVSSENPSVGATSASGFPSGPLPFSAVLLLLASLLLSGCRPLRLAGGTDVRATSLETVRHARDSVVAYVFDSVLIREKGDTVYVAHSSIRYRDRWLTRSDTVVLRDSIFREHPVVLEKPLSRWVRFQLQAGRCAMAVLLIWLLLKGVRRYVRPFSPF